MRIESANVRSTTDAERGVALVIVLWVLTLLSLLVLTYRFDSRTDLLILRNQNEMLQARATADAGVTLAILGVFDPSPAGQWRADGTVHALTYRQGSLRVSVQDERGKVDVNAAPDIFLRSLFQTLGIASDIGEEIIGEIERFRSSGALDAVALASAPPTAVPINPFLTVDELRLLPAVTPDLYDRISPFVTVYSGSPQIDPYTAPPEVLRSVPGIRPDEADTLLATRSSGGEPPLTGPRLTGVARFVFRSPLQVFTIYSEGTTPAGTRFIREATATLTGIPETPYRFLAWREVHPRATGTNPG